MQVVVIGVDGLDRRTLERDGDSLPALTALAERGVTRPLESTHPPVAESAWPSLYTGTDPSHHGVFGSSRIEGYPEKNGPISRVDVRRPALWEYLSSEGAGAVVMDVPVTRPVEPINGVIVPKPLVRTGDTGDSDENSTDRAGSVEPDLAELADVEPDARDAADDDRHRVDRRTDRAWRRRAFCSLLEREEWELAICRAPGPDAGARDSRGERRGEARPRQPPFEPADRLVRDVLETVDDDTTVLVCSTHGVAPVTGWEIGLNDVLFELGYLERTQRAGCHERRRATVSSEAEREPGSPDTTILSRVAETLRLETVLDRLGSSFGYGHDHGRSHGSGNTVDWHESIAYCTSGDRLGVRINLAGREPDGIVPPSKYEAVRDDLVDALSKLETPDGETAFDRVDRSERVFDGPFDANAPDVLVRPARTRDAVSAELTGRPFRSVESTRRTFDGVFVGAGPGFDHETRADQRGIDERTATDDATTPERLSITDVAPIVLAMLGRPVPTLMTGRVPEGLVRDGSVCARYRNVAVGTTTTDPTFDDADVPGRVDGLNSWYR